MEPVVAASSSVYVIDDDLAVVRLICNVLSNHGYATRGFRCGEDFFALNLPQEPGCLITDLHLPGITGEEIQAQLRKAGSPLSVIVISGAADVPTAVQVMKNGAVTFLLKPYTTEALLEAVEQGVASSMARLQRSERADKIRELLSRLTEEERQVLEFVVQGASNKVISTNLVLSTRTVDRRRQAIFQKLEVKSPQELAALMATADQAHR